MKNQNAIRRVCYKFTLSTTHLQILKERQAEYLKDKSTARPWREVHDEIRNKRKSK
ncbi:MAG: hypothetical protein V4649_18445 [Bacteroidota bacterium]